MAMQQLHGLAAAFALSLAVSTGASAQVFNEVGDASNVFNGGVDPQAVGNGITTINGTIGTTDLGDLYKLVFATGGTLTIDAVATGPDLMLFLFDATGAGLQADDDSGPGVSPQITQAIAAGTYYLGIGDYITEAVDLEGDTWNTVLSNTTPPANFGTLDFIRTEDLIFDGPYTISLSLRTSTATVPEPATLALLGAGLAGLVLVRRKRRSV